MELNIIQRILIFSVLPQEGNLLTMKSLKGLKDKIVFTEEEVKEYEIRMDEGNYRWNPKKDSYKTFEITEGEEQLITTGLKILDSEGKLTEQHLSLCDKFPIN